MSNEDYYQTKASVDAYIKAAEGVDSRQLIARLNARLNKGAHLLELGSGPGTDWKILSESYTVTGSDNSAEFLNRLRNKHPKGTFLNLDAATLGTDQQFNGIYSNKVLHHLSDEAVVASVKRQKEILKPGGIICHSFWYGEGNEIFNGMFVNYHDMNNLLRFFGEDFELLSLQRYTEFETDDSICLMGRKA